MTKPDITLERGKGVVSEMAARIYSAHIVRGDVKDGEETKWMERSIREAVRIAKTVDASIDSDDASAATENSGASGDKPSDPSTEGSRENPELDAVIEQTLLAEDPPARKSDVG